MDCVVDAPAKQAGIPLARETVSVTGSQNPFAQSEAIVLHAPEIDASAAETFREKLMMAGIVPLAVYPLPFVRQLVSRMKWYWLDGRTLSTMRTASSNTYVFILLTMLTACIPILALELGFAHFILGLSGTALYLWTGAFVSACTMGIAFDRNWSWPLAIFFLATIGLPIILIWYEFEYNWWLTIIGSFSGVTHCILLALLTENVNRSQWHRDFCASIFRYLPDFLIRWMIWPRRTSERRNAVSVPILLPVDHGFMARIRTYCNTGHEAYITLPGKAISFSPERLADKAVLDPWGVAVSEDGKWGAIIAQYGPEPDSDYLAREARRFIA